MALERGRRLDQLLLLTDAETDPGEPKDQNGETSILNIQYMA